MTKPKNKPDDGSIPKHVLNQINEHALGGYVLFYFNRLTGEPEQSLVFDSPIHYLALLKHMENWSEIVKTVHLDNSIENMHENIRKANGEDGEE